MTTLDLETARQFILQNQLLAPSTKLSGKEGAQAVIEHLGYVQIDSISVIERAHHHVLWTRVPDYRPDILNKLTSDDRTVFEYWAHAASFLPMKDYRFSLYRKSNMDKGGGFWRRTDPKIAKHVLDRIRTEGPLMSKDFVKHKTKADHAWKTPTINQVILQLFMTGELMVAERKGIQKTFDLPERLLPFDTDTRTPAREEYIGYFIRRDLRSHGLKNLREMGYLLRIPGKEKLVVLQKMVKSGEVEEVKIKGLEDTYFAFAERLKNFEPGRKKRFHLLSPFDNLIIQRRRLSELFGFEYTIECYVPPAKRKFGYFGLPMLYGTNIIGQIDLKADRKEGALLVKNIEWKKGQPKAMMKRAFEKKLSAFAKFCGCEEIRW